MLVTNSVAFENEAVIKEIILFFEKEKKCLMQIKFKDSLGIIFSYLIKKFLFHFIFLGNS